MVHGAGRAENGGEGPSGSRSRSSNSTNSTNSSSSRTLHDAMREPSANAPGVVVLDTAHDEKERKEYLDPRADLWLSSADGRYNSPIIPLRVGSAPDAQTFWVHKNILLQTQFFSKALCGDFKEAQAQAVDLPEEDPVIFHFVVAFLYEGKYAPIRPLAAVLDEEEKGKGVEGAAAAAEAAAAASDSDSSSASLGSDASSARVRRRRERQRRRATRDWEAMRQKRPGAHRLGCGCQLCLNLGGPPCWNCSAPRVPPGPVPSPPPPLPGLVVMHDHHRARARHQHHHRRAARDRHHQAAAAARPASPSSSRPAAPSLSSGDRMQGEDLRAWLLAYELSLDVYICANRLLLDDLGAAVSRVCIDMLETAGADAAQPAVLRLCHKLHAGLPESDALLRMVLARVGFMQMVLWSRFPDETSDFLLAHPEVSALMHRETASRREMDHAGQLPAMERASFLSPFDAPFVPYGRPPPPPMPRPRW